jgi:hypothetical protein
MFKSKLLLGTVLAASTMMIAAQARAFDNVEWSWDADVNTDVSVDLNISDPSEFGMVEILQTKLGDTTATSNVHGIDNNQPMQGTASGTFTFEGEAWKNGVLGNENPTVDAYNTQTSGNVDGIAAGQGSDPSSFGMGGTGNGPDIEGGIAEQTGNLSNANISVSGAVYDAFGADGVGNGETDGVVFTVTMDGVEVSDTTYDAATELPELSATATAFANNSSVSGSGVVNIHAGQFTFDPAGSATGGGNDAPSVASSGYGYDSTSPNSNLSGAMALTTLALNGGLAPSQISATSNAYDINNFSVDASATALANNLSISVEPGSASGTEAPAPISASFNGPCYGPYCGGGDDSAEPGIQPDVALIADVTQFAYADVMASSNVHDVTLNNYTGLGSLDQPVINGAATAIGNNLSIKVGAPAVDVNP